MLSPLPREVFEHVKWEEVFECVKREGKGFDTMNTTTVDYPRSLFKAWSR